MRKLGIVGELEQNIFWIILATFVISEMLFGLKGAVGVLLPLSFAFIGMGSIFYEWQDEWQNFFLSVVPPPPCCFSGVPDSTITAVGSSFSSWLTKPPLAPPRSCLA